MKLQGAVTAAEAKWSALAAKDDGVVKVITTIPAEATVPFETGTLINVTQVGAGVATVRAAAGVSLNGITAGSVALSGPWSGAALTKRGTNAWVIQGALAGAVA